MADPFDELWDEAHGKKTVTKDPFDAAWDEAHATAPIPGMEKLGALPGVGTPNSRLLPNSLQTSGERWANAPMRQNSRTGEMKPVTPMGEAPILDMPFTGIDKMTHGVQAGSQPGFDAKLGGASQVLRGGMETAAPFLMPAAAIGAPVALGTGLATGTAGAYAGEGAATALGLPPGAAALTGDIAGIASGVAGSRMSGGSTAQRNDPHIKMVQAVKPAAGLTKFRDNLKLSMPELKAMETKLGRPIEGIEDLLGNEGSPGLIREAMKANREQYHQMTGDQQGTVINGKSIANAIRGSISKKLRLENPNEAARIEALASKYDRKIPIEDAQDYLVSANAELNGYYAKNPSAKGVDVRANPETALLNAQAEALRTGIYEALDAPGGGAAARALQKRYGALMELEGQLYRRMNVTMRQQPESLSEQLSGWAAAGEIIKGGTKMATGNFWSGAGDVLGAIGKKKIASMIKEGQTTDALIRKAFSGYDFAPEPIVMPVGSPTPFSLPQYGPVGPPNIGPRPIDVNAIAGGQVRPVGTPGVGPANVGVAPIDVNAVASGRLRATTAPGVGPVNIGASPIDTKAVASGQVRSTNTPGAGPINLGSLPIDVRSVAAGKVAIPAAPAPIVGPPAVGVPSGASGAPGSSKNMYGPTYKPTEYTKIKPKAVDDKIKPAEEAPKTKDNPKYNLFQSGTRGTSKAKPKHQYEQ